ncbi:class I SAM-dependent methyltransferase [Christensenellaceae bacterium 44-20]
MQDNTLRFDGKAALYGQYRPSYPAEYFDYLFQKARLEPEDAIADIGAGTGIFTRQLLGCGFSVFAVEPGEDMRRQGREHLGDTPGLRWVSGSAEQTTLPPGSVGLVTAAQAFHWFDREKFAAECRRILRPGGLVALVWNIWAPECALTQRCAEVFSRYCPGFHGFSGGSSVAPDALEPFFLDRKMGYRQFPNDLFYDWDAFLGRMLSSSYAPKEQDAQYPALVEALRRIFEEESQDGILRFPMRTRSFLGRPA